MHLGDNLSTFIIVKHTGVWHSVVHAQVDWSVYAHAHTKALLNSIEATRLDQTDVYAGTDPYQFVHDIIALEVSDEIIPR